MYNYNQPLQNKTVKFDYGLRTEHIFFENESEKTIANWTGAMTDTEKHVS